MQYPIYLDYNATTPCHQDVIDAMLPFFGQHFGNASSKSHAYGWMAEEAVEIGRQKVAKLIGAKSKEIIFTSGATEAANLAIKGIYEVYAAERIHIITCATEHKAILDPIQKLEKKGVEVTYLPVDVQGKLDLGQLEKAIRPHTKMIALMWANNETGVCHPISQIAALAEKHGIIFFTDAVQVAGKIPISTAGIHLMAISAHKLYGPKGIGALFIRHNHPLPKPMPILEGGGHEKGFRSGTLNVPAIVGFGKAAEIALANSFDEANRLRTLRDRLELEILNIPGTSVNGHPASRLPHVSNIAFAGVEGEELLRRVNLKVAVSSGSACTSISPKPSHVLQAMGLTPELGKASLRFSLGQFTTTSDIDNTAAWVKQQVSELRAL
jgi:cysteine desulfurase